MRKPHATLLLLGPPGHGKTTVAAALLRASRPAERDPGGLRETSSTDEPQPLQLPRAATLPLALAQFEYETARRRYTLLDPGEPLAPRKRLIAGPLAGLPPVDGVLLVVNPGLEPGRRPGEDLRVAHKLGITGIVVYLNQVDPAGDELLDLAEYELRVWLGEAGFDGDAVPIVRGCGDDLARAGPAAPEAVLTLQQALDEHVPLPVEACPVLPIARIVASQAREAEVECRPLHGVTAPGETLEIVGISTTRTAQLAAVVEAPGGPDAASARVRCALRGVSPSDLRVGQVLSYPGAVAPHSRFEAEVWSLVDGALPAEEWQLCFFDVFTVGAVVRRLRERSSSFEVDLATALALAPGEGFGVLADGALIGVGVVTVVRGAGRKRRRGALSPTGLAMALVDTLNRGDRPDLAAASLYPPDDVLQNTADNYATDVRPSVQSGRVLLRLIEVAHLGPHEQGTPYISSYPSLVAQRDHVEFLGLREHTRRRMYRAQPSRRASGESVMAYGDREGQTSRTSDYLLKAGVTSLALRFQVRVRQENRDTDLMIEVMTAEFDVNKGRWYVFDFYFPYTWDRL